MCALCGIYPYPVSVSDFTDFFKNCHNSIRFCQNKSKKITRLNNDERNQAIGMLNAGMLATVVSRHFGCTQKTIKRLRRRFHVTGNVADCPLADRSCVTTAVDDRNIVLQHLHNSRVLTKNQIYWDK